MGANSETGGTPLIIGNAQGRGRAVLLWGMNIPQQNRAFVKSIDPEFFIVTAKDSLRGLQGDEDHKHRRATAIRLTYHHATETLFALLFAYLQAPHCIYGWVHEYSTAELRGLVTAVSNGEAFPSVMLTTPATWDTIASGIWCSADLPADKRGGVVSDTAGFLKTLADEFLSVEAIAEYNSIKHGMRVTYGSFSFSFTVPPDPSKGRDKEVVYNFTGGEHGTGCLSTVKIPGANHQRTTAVHSINYDPARVVSRIEVICYIIQALKSHVTLLHGWEEHAQYLYSDEIDFGDMWEPGSNAHRGSFTYQFGSSDEAQNFTKDDVFAEYAALSARFHVQPASDAEPAGDTQHHTPNPANADRS